jgi:LuxR family maltose regulon positive regulatory protein
MNKTEKNSYIPLTKFKLPSIDKRWIERPRLFEALDKTLGSRLTLISAPAGYGKTTLVLKWLDHVSCQCTWVSVDENDNTPDRFLSVLIDSICNVFPNFGSQTKELLSAPILPLPEYLADILINDLATLEPPLILAIDDFHLVTSKDVHKIIKRLIRYLPEGLQFLIASRVDPPLPLNQWYINQWLCKLDADDLSFVEEEAIAFFGSVQSEALPINNIEQLVARTEGWAVGLKLMLLNFLSGDNSHTLTSELPRGRIMVAEYLFDEVINCQPDEVKLFLSITAILERFCVSLCDHLLDQEPARLDSREAISYLIKNNLFIVSLDKQRTWYRYHHQFHEMLRLNSRSEIPQIQKNKYHQKAGEWYAYQGYYEDALKHLIAGGNIDAASELLGEKMHSIINQDLSRRDLKRLLDMFPDGAEELRPELLVAHAFLKMTNFDLKNWGSLMDRAEALLKKPDCIIPTTRRQSLLGDIAVQRGSYWFYQGDLERALSYSEQGIQVIPKKHRYSNTLGLVCNSAARFLCGQEDDALLQLNMAINNDHSEGSLNVGQLLVTKMIILTFAADWNAVEENAQKLLFIDKTVPQDNYWLGCAYYFLGCSAYEQNMLDVAADYFSYVETMRYHVATRIYHDSIISLALISLAKGDVKTAEKYLEESYSSALEMKDSFSAQISESVKIKWARSTGKVAMDPLKYSSVSGNVFFWLVFPSLLYADLLNHKYSHQNTSDALEFIDRTTQRINPHHVRLHLQFQAAKAVALKCHGRLSESLELFEDAIGLAEPLGLVRSFVDRGPTIVELLNLLVDKSPDNSYLHMLIDACMSGNSGKNKMALASVNSNSLAPASKEFNSTSIDLSNRELDVLILLEKRLSNKEIADRLFISAETVKTHLSSIYRKLKVHNRRQASKMARRHNLIPERRRKFICTNICW